MDFSLIVMWKSMGFAARAVVFVLAIMSIYVVGVSLERWRHYAKGRKLQDEFILRLRALFEEKGGQSLAEAFELASSNRNAPTASVVYAATQALAKRTAQVDALDLVVGINRAVERTIERETSNLKRGLGGLATIASTSPFVGLFGTVVGIINAFQSMAVSGSGGLASVSAGIAEALVTTAFGLLVAIPSVGLYNYFTGTVDTFAVDMDEIASEVVELVLLAERKA